MLNLFHYRKYVTFYDFMVEVIIGIMHKARAYGPILKMHRNIKVS